MPVTTHRLTNGLTVAVAERRELLIVQLEIVIAAGAELDTPAHAGRTSMTAEMLDEGTQLRSALQIAEEIDYLGADLSVQPGWDAITISLHVMSERLDAALDVMTDVLLNAAFPDSEFERKRQERLSALLHDRDEPHLLAGKAMAAGVFGGEHPYGAPIDGTRTSIAGLSRAEVQSRYRTHVHAGNAFVVVVGDVDTTAVVATLEARLASWHSQPAAHSATAKALPALSTRVLLVDKPGAAQAELRVGHAAPDRTTSDYFALNILNTILGGAFTSRLNMILREQMGVTYGARSRFRLRRTGGIFSAGAAVATEAVARSAQVIIEEMTRLRDEPVSTDELTRAQSYVALGLPRHFETNDGIAAHLREQILYGLPMDYWERYVDNIFAVTAENIASAAARHLQPESCVVAVVADGKHVQRALEKTRLGDVIVTDMPI